MWGSGRDVGHWEGAAAPWALPLQEGVGQGVQLVHLLLDLQVGPLAEARGCAGWVPRHPPNCGWMEIGTKMPPPAKGPAPGGKVSRGAMDGTGPCQRTWVISRMDITLSRAFCSRS